MVYTGVEYASKSVILKELYRDVLVWYNKSIHAKQRTPRLLVTVHGALTTHPTREDAWLPLILPHSSIFHCHLKSGVPLLATRDTTRCQTWGRCVASNAGF